MLLDQELIERCVLYGDDDEMIETQDIPSPEGSCFTCSPAAVGSSSSSSSLLGCSPPAPRGSPGKSSVAAAALEARLSKRLAALGMHRDISRIAEDDSMESEALEEESLLLTHAIRQLEHALQRPTTGCTSLLGQDRYASWQAGVSILFSLATASVGGEGIGNRKAAMTMASGEDKEGHGVSRFSVFLSPQAPYLPAALLLADMVEWLQPYAADFYQIQAFLSRSAAARRRKHRLHRETEGHPVDPSSPPCAVAELHRRRAEGVAERSAKVSAKKCGCPTLKSRVTWSVGAVVPITVIQS